MARTARSLVRSAATVTGAVAVAAGVSLVGLPAASAAEPTGITIVNEVSMFDVDGNGVLDPYVADLSGDGVLDLNIVIYNGSYLWLYDQNQNGRPDVYGEDFSGDLAPDVWGYDSNEDVVLDSWAYDAAVLPVQQTFVVTVTVLQDCHPYG